MTRQTNRPLEHPDLASMSDTDLIFAMGGHVPSCGCLLCDEWRRRNLFNVPLVALTLPKE